MQNTILELAEGIRNTVLPFIGEHSGRGHASEAVGGDVTFELDRLAESYLERFIRERAPNLAFFSEDRGLVKPTGQAEKVLVVDPIDGTRPALAGLESACVSIALAPYGDDVTMSDAELGCIQEIKSGTVFIARRDHGLSIREGDGSSSAPALSDTTEIDRMFWSLGFRGRPARVLVEVLGNLIDRSSVGGGVFDLGSATFDMTRLLTGQLDAYLDVGTRIIDDVPATRADFERVGGGAILNNSPYDLVAGVLCLEEAGAVVTDAYGQSLGDRLLLGSSHEFQMSCVASSNSVLHAKILESIEEGVGLLAKTNRKEGQHNPDHGVS